MRRCGNHSRRTSKKTHAKTRTGELQMAKVIVSYDDTDNDRDALALGRVLGELGGEISLAYVRHTQQPDSAREALEEREAEELLAHGAEALGDEQIDRHVVVHASTGAGLWELAEGERAYAIETANAPVIAVARGTEVKFAKPGIVRRVAAKA